MRSRQKISRAGIELIEAFEGLRCKAARLPDGRWTIGYGHTRSAREGAEVSAADAEALLLFDLMGVVEAVNDLVLSPISQNQFDALAAFAFNVGQDAFRESDVLKRVNEGRLTEAACALDGWRRAELGGDALVLDALIRRRAAEKALFLTPEGGFVATPSPLIRPLLDASAVELQPRARPVEIETPLEGDTAEVRRFDLPPEPEAEPAAAPEPAPEAPESPLEPERLPAAAVVFSIASAPEPASQPALETAALAAPEAVTVELPRLEVAAVAAAVVDLTPEETRQEQQTEALEASEPGAEAIGLAETQTPAEDIAPTMAAVAYFAPAEPPAAASPVEAANDSPIAAPPETPPAAQAEPALAAPAEVTPAPEPQPLVQPQQQAKTLAEGFVGNRVYGPMAAAALGSTAAEPRPAAQPKAPVDPISTFGPPAPLSTETAAAVAPKEALHADTRPPPGELVLTPPPENFDRPDTPGPADPPPPEPVYEDEQEAPLFADAWEGGSNGRIVRHEAMVEEPRVERPGSGLLALTGVVGLAAFLGAVAAFLKGRAGGADDMTTYAWLLALIGVGCVATAVYFLLKRMGGVTE
jgi:lysozyme